MFDKDLIIPAHNILPLEVTCLNFIHPSSFSFLTSAFLRMQWFLLMRMEEFFSPLALGLDPVLVRYIIVMLAIKKEKRKL